jgi:hypothetical protein
MVLILAFALLTIATVALAIVLTRGELRQRRTPPRPRARSSTIRVGACRLAKDAMVLMPSTPHRFRIERVLWIERQLGGGVVANLEGNDPDTGTVTQRWHHWQPRDLVTVFVADVRVDVHEGNFDGVYERYSSPQAEPEASSRTTSSSVIDQTLERLYGNARPS